MSSKLPYSLHPRDIYLHLLNHLDSAIALGSAAAASSLLLLAGSVEGRAIRPWFFAGGAAAALGGLRARAIFGRSQRLMDIAGDESATGIQAWYRNEMAPTLPADFCLEGLPMPALPSSYQPELADFAQIVSDTRHWLIKGSTGSGKSTLARWLAGQIAADGADVVVVDPHDTTPSAWGGLPVVGKGRDYGAIAALMSNQLDEHDRRYARRAAGRPVGNRLVVVVDEYPAICASEEAGEIAPHWFGTLAMESRKVGFRLIILLQSDSVAVLGLEGKGELRENFGEIALGEFAVARGKKLKDKDLVEWLRRQPRPVMVCEASAILPDLSALPPLGAEQKSLEAAAAEESSPPELPGTVSAPLPPAVKPAPEEAVPAVSSEDEARLEEIARLKQCGLSQTAIIRSIWNCSGGRRYQQARAEYRRLTGE
jgi:energy-coupling factor transporter ATP-binding protein EcfA2